MADQFSDHFADVQPGLILNTQRRASAGISHGRKRTKIARVTLDLSPSAFGVGDVARIAQFKSSDRIEEILVTSGGASTVLTADLGLYRTGQNHDGAVVDADLFASALALNGVIARVDEFTEAGTLDNFDRFLTLWELAAIGAATFTEDPFLDFDLALTGTAAIATADEPIVIEVTYTSGD